MIKSLARTLFHTSGAVRAVRWFHRKRMRILMYHRFSDRDAIVTQCAHIRGNYQPVSLTQAADWLLCGGGWPDNAIVVTVDDGYRDFYEVAYPVFREYGIPATVYLVSEFLDGREWLWGDRVRWAYLRTASQGGTREQRLKAALVAIEAAKQMPNHNRLAWLDQLPGELGVEWPDEAPPEYAPLSWDQVREAAQGGIEFGAHTRTHPILSMVAGERELTVEIAGSKRRIEEQLGCAVDHFCYPNGSLRDFNASAVQAVRAAGYRTAVTTVPGTISGSAELLRLPRIGVEPGLEERYFAECVTGFRS